MSVKITAMQPNQIAQLIELAEPIWHEHYAPIIGIDQVTYMLEKYQSETAIKEQISQGYQYFLVEKDAMLIGYCSLQVRKPSSLFISKFYLAKSARGQGAGKTMMSFVENFARQNGCNSLDLTVNKNNSSYEIYLKLGFVNNKSVKMDIGEGYFMDDYVMSKQI